LPKAGQEFVFGKERKIGRRERRKGLESLEYWVGIRMELIKNDIISKKY
jgi:hypothetical protein